MLRRRFLTTGLAGIACYFGWRWWKFRPHPIAQAIRSYITPKKEFFKISIKPGFRPQVDLEQYRLSLRGPDGSRDLSFEDLLQGERVSVTRTLMCVGNPVGGRGLANAVWTCTPLAPLLNDLIGDRREGLSVVFRSMDGFYSSVPLEVALDRETYLAYEMNGEALPKAHGYPLRVLIPGKYGMKQPRWLQEIEVTSGWVSGHWENWGWSYDCDIKMTAHVNSATRQPGDEWLITGVAFCGDESVGRVEVSVDDGDSWREAELLQRPLPGVWSTWELPWKPEKPGRYLVTARVVDSKGNRQIESYSGSYPSGSTGLHRVIVEV